MPESSMGWTGHLLWSRQSSCGPRVWEMAAGKAVHGGAPVGDGGGPHVTTSITISTGGCAIVTILLDPITASGFGRPLYATASGLAQLASFHCSQAKRCFRTWLGAKATSRIWTGARGSGGLSPLDGCGARGTAWDAREQQS